MVRIPTMFIQSSDDVVDIVGEEPPAVQDGGKHGGYGPAGHHLIVGVLVHLAEKHAHWANKDVQLFKKITIYQALGWSPGGKVPWAERQ